MDFTELKLFCRIKNNFDKIKSVKTKCLYGNEALLNSVDLTICIPTYKREKTLQQAIKSALNQKSSKIKYCIVIVDNDSDSKCQNILNLVKSYNDERLIYYKNEVNIGMFNNWNRCFEITKSKWISLLHDDDLLKPEYISYCERIIPKLEKKNIPCLCFAYNKLYKDGRGKIKVSFLKKIYKKILIRLLEKQVIMTRMNSSFVYLYGGNPFSMPTCGILFNRNSILETGGFNDELYPSADFLLIFYLMETKSVYYCHNTSGTYRWEYNESLRPDVERKFIEDSYKQILFIGKEHHILMFLFNRLLLKEKRSLLEYNIHYNSKILYLIRKVLAVTKLYSNSIDLYE